MTTKKKTYSSFNGLSRSALVWGVPLMPALMSTTACIMVGMLLQAFFGGAGLLFILLAIPLILFIKKICANDDKAIDILKLEMSCFLNRANSACFGGTYTLAPIKYGRNINVYKRSFEKTAQH